MPKILYVPKTFNADHQQMIDRANTIIAEYRRQGYDLTLRQLYYQFVSRDFLANNDKNYKKLGNVISDARRAGLVDWEAIVDRTRNLRTHTGWRSPAAIVRACAAQFDVDWWEHQTHHVEVWIEKDALIGVLERACEEWRCGYFSCRGYTSDSEVWGAGQRLIQARGRGKKPVILHLGDHDPSGIDMTRDIGDRLEMFSGRAVEIRRLALNMDQVEQYEPPPNPAKTTDARFGEYQRTYGDESWELDALDPTTITDLIATEMRTLIDNDAWEECQRRRDEGREQLSRVSDQWGRIIENLEQSDE